MGEPQASTDPIDADTLPVRPASYSGFGRPTELTYELINRIAERIQRGNYPLTAARAEGVAERSWMRWTDRGRKDDAEDTASIYAHLWQVIDQKDAEAEDSLLQASLGRIVGWQGPMTALSRRFRGGWEDKQVTAQGLVIHINAPDARIALLSPGEGVVLERRSEDTGLISGGSDNSTYVNQD